MFSNYAFSRKFDDIHVPTHTVDINKAKILDKDSNWFSREVREDI